jgi:hypothetical protein
MGCDSTTDMLENAILEITQVFQKADGRIVYVYVRPPNSITKSNCQSTPSDLSFGIEPFSLFAA